MPKSVAQLTGLIVTAIVTFGTDLDLTYAMPLGVAAGMLATFFVALSEARQPVFTRRLSRQPIKTP